MQYLDKDDSEWLVYPIQKEGVELELDLYPEDVVMTANGTSLNPRPTPPVVVFVHYKRLRYKPFAVTARCEIRLQTTK